MASTAIFIPAPYNIKGKGDAAKVSIIPLPLRTRTLYLLYGYNFTAVVGAARQAGMVGHLDLLTLRTDRKVWGLEVLVGTPFIPAGFGCFVFWIGHVSCITPLFFE
jgi:hypothetical protein